MALVLIHDDGPDCGLIHETDKSKINSQRTVCGEKLHPASSTFTPELFVTCPKCLRQLSRAHLQEQLNRVKAAANEIFKAAHYSGWRMNTEIRRKAYDNQIVFDVTIEEDGEDPGLYIKNYM
jgi:hypothetical protein